MSFLLNAGNFQLPGGGAVANGSVILTLSNPSATIIATGGAATTSYTINLDASGNIPAGTTVLGNGELTPAGTYYTAQLYTAANGTGTLISTNNWVIGPSAPYAGTLFPDVNVYPAISVSGTVSGAFSITGNTGLPTASTVDLFLAGNFGTPVLGKIYVGDGTGWELDFAKRSASTDTTVAKITDKGQILSTGTVASGIGAFACSPNSFIDGSTGTSGQGGLLVFTNDATTTAGYSVWATNNAYWNGTQWIQMRGVGTSSHGLAVSHHKDFSFNFAAAVGTNNTAITWTEWANLGAGGFNLKTGTYQVNGVQIAASNLSNGVTGTGAVVLATSPTLTTPNIGAATATSVNKVAITAPATSATLTIANGKTLTANNSLTFAGVDATTITFQATDTYVGRATTDTLTNKRITQRLISTTSAAAAPLTLTADSDNFDINAWVLTGTGGTITLANPTGTPTDGQKLTLRIKSTNAMTYAFGANFAFSTSITAPTTLAAGKTDYIGCIWNATNTKWDVVAVDQGH